MKPNRDAAGGTGVPPVTERARLHSCVVVVVIVAGALPPTIGCGGATCGEPAFGSEALCPAPAPRLAVNVDGERQCVGENMNAETCALVLPGDAPATVGLINIGRRDGLEVALSGDVASTDDVTIEASTLTATLERAAVLEIDITAPSETLLTWLLDTNASGTDRVLTIELRFE